MTASEIAIALAPALMRQGFKAVTHPNPTPNGHGHKITLFEQTGPALGTLVIYAGKSGPRYTTNELRSNTPALLARLAQAWDDSGHRHFAETTRSHDASSLPTPSAQPNTIELWVDGACLQQPQGLKFGWAYLIRKDGLELARHAHSAIPPVAASLRNVAAEIQAVIRGLEACRQRGFSEVTIYYDYEGLAAWPTGRWQANTLFTREYVKIVQQCGITITWHKVQAHTGIPCNELVDQLATSAASNSFERYPISQ